MPTRMASIPSALCGIIGPLVLVASFRINPAPPADATVSQLAEFANVHVPLRHDCQEQERCEKHQMHNSLQHRRASRAQS